MAIWPFRSGAVEKKEHPGGAAFLIGGPVAWGDGRSADKYIKEGYQLNVIVYRAISEIVKAAASLQIELYGASGKAIERHPVLDLLKRPTPTLTWDAWVAEMLINRMLLGEQACARPEGQSKPAELWPIAPNYIDVRPGRGGIPSEYIYRNNNAKVIFPVENLTGNSDLMFVKTYNPSNYWRGQSPLMAAALAADTHNAGLRWNYGLLANSARPSGLIQFKGGYPENEVINRMREFFKTGTQGPENAGEVAMLSDDAEWVSMSQTSRDMDFSTTMKEAAKYVASAFGVPLPLIDNDASTFNNLEQAKERLYTDTVIPIVEELLSALNNWLLPAYGTGLELRIDMDEIPALEGLRERKYNRAAMLYEKGMLTRQEARVLVGYEPEGAGDFKESGGLFDLPLDDAKAIAYGLNFETKGADHG